MTANPVFLPYARQTVDADDIAAVTRVLEGDWLTTGPDVTAFEGLFAAKFGAGHAVACASGTAALHLAALAIGLKPGDHAVVPSMSFSATANAVRYTGAEVIFADVDPASGLMRARDFDAALDRADDAAVAAVFPVHLNGQCSDLAAIAAIARDRGIAIVEDACHAIGGGYRGDRVIGGCADSDITMFSLHPAKTLTAGEGGVLTTNDAALARRLQLFRGHGITHDADEFQDQAMARDTDGRINPWYYELQGLGFNYRITDFQCALGASQLAKLDCFVARRRDLTQCYDDALAALSPIVRPVARSRDCQPAWHLYAARIDFTAARVTRAQLMRGMRADGIGTQVHYIPIHQQPYYRARYGAQSLPGVEAYYAHCLSLPLFSSMRDSDVARVAASLGAALG
jgi:UDP-4-amino-4,6-dideoxy-N-acetyl-beta-L-altrosamine transaminase